MCAILDTSLLPLLQQVIGHDCQQIIAATQVEIFTQSVDFAF